MTPPQPSSSATRFAFIAIAVLTLAVHGIDARHRFVAWDDGLLVTHNELLNPVTPDHFAQFWTGPVKGLYTPMAYSLWAAITPVARTAADAQGVSLHPMPFHLLNVLLHAGCSLLVLAILLRLTAGRVLASAIGAALFAVHPLQVEAVAWVSGMNNLLAGLFSLACIAAYLRWARPTLAGGETDGARSRAKAARRGTPRPSPLPSPRRGEGVWYVACCVLFALAMGSKPTAVVTPVVLAAVELAILRRPVRRIARCLAPLLLIALPFVIVGRAAQESGGVISPTWPQRLLIASDALGWYLGKLAWPWPLYLDYGRTPESVLAAGGSLPTWIALGVAVIGAAGTVRRWPWIAGSLAVFAGGMCVVLGLVPFDFQLYSTVADRYAYLSMLGAAILLAMLLARAPKAACGVAIIVVAALAIGSVRQSLTWRDTDALLAHQSRHRPDSLAVHTIQAQLARERKDVAALEQHLRAAVALRPNDVDANAALADLLRDAGRAEESLAYYQAAYDAGDRRAALMNNWGLALFALKRYPQAEDAFRAAIAANPGLYNGHMNLGRVLANQGKLPESEQHFGEALRLRPESAEAREALAKVIALQGR